MGPYQGNIETEVEDEKSAPRAKHLEEGSGSSSDEKQRAEWREVQEPYPQTKAMTAVNGDSTTQTYSKRRMLRLK